MKKTLAWLLALAMVLGMIPAPAFAAATEPNITISVDKTEVEVGDTITVTLGIKEMTGTSLAFGFDFDTNLLQATTVPRKSAAGIDFETYDPDADEIYEETLSPTAISTKANVNDDGHFGVAYAYDLPEEALYFENDAVITLKFKAIANGTVEFQMFEDSAGTDGYKGSWTFPEAPTEPACKHDSTKLVPNNDGTHNEVCANADCGEVLNANVKCSGTDDGDHTTAVKCACGNTVTDGTDHVDANPKDHSCDVVGCDHAMGEHKSNAQYACQDGKCEYCGKDVPASANHTDSNDDKDHNCDVCGTENIEGHTETTVKVEVSKATCEDPATFRDDTVCSECGITIANGEPYTEGDPNGHTWITVDYDWSDDYSACTAKRTCKKGCEETAEAVVTTRVFIPATCVSLGWTNLVADFNVDWAVDQNTNIPNIPVNSNNHNGVPNSTTYDDNGDGTHTVTVTCQCNTVLSTDTVAHTYVDGNCVCGDVEEFIITWNINGVETTEAYAVGATPSFKGDVDIPEEDCKVYTFQGWHVEDFFGAEDTLLTEFPVVTGNATYYAVYSFDYNHEMGEVAYDWNQGADGSWSCTAQRVCQKNHAHVDTDHGFTIGKVTEPATCTEKGWTTYTASYASSWAKTQTKAVQDVAIDPTNHATPDMVYSVDNNDGTHNTYFDCCDAPFATNVPHEYDVDEHTCSCGKVETFTLTIRDMEVDINGAESKEFDVPYGTNVLGFVDTILDQLDLTDKTVESSTHIGTFSWGDAWYAYVNGEYQDDFGAETVMTSDMELCVDSTFTGWTRIDEDEVWGYDVDNAPLYGWHEIDGAWYYFFINEETGWSYRAERLTRAPYPTEVINGVSYGPDADAMAYYAAKGETFVDAEMAWFRFAEDGKFQSDFTGTGGYLKPYYVNGMQTWHPGVVENGSSGDYYYYVGNTADGGNKIPSDGDIYVQKVSGNNSNTIEFVIGGVYTVKVGEIQKYNGITEVGGKLRYYENAQLMMGKGLTKVGENYIYVRSNGELVVDAEYYVPANSLDILSGTYYFDANGFMVNPESAEKDGIVAENGGLYFYENGKIAYNKGLIEYNGGVIYVRSNGKLAVGEYYVTNLKNYTGSDVKSGDKVIFGEDGFMIEMKNGIVGDYYYINNKIAYDLGLIETADGYIYVRSNGKVVMGTSYWITRVNDTGVVAKMYVFDANGILQNPEFVSDLDGIVEKDGKLYYYEEGAIAYGKGLVKLADENGEFFIYVRSNGQLATGKYWPTTTNGYELEAPVDFGIDGKFYI